MVKINFKKESYRILFDNIGEETEHIEFKQIGLSPSKFNFYSKIPFLYKLNHDIFNGYISHQYQELILITCERLVKKFLPKFLSACSRLDTNKQIHHHIGDLPWGSKIDSRKESKIMFGISDIGTICGIPILREYENKFNQMLEHTIRDVCSNLMCVSKYEPKTELSLESYDLDKCEVIPSKYNENIIFTDEQLINYETTTDINKYKFYGKIRDKKKYLEKINVKILNLEISDDPIITEEQLEENLRLTIKKFEEKAEYNKKEYERFIIEKTQFVTLMRNYSRQNDELFFDPNIKQAFDEYLKIVKMKELNDSDIFTSPKGEIMLIIEEKKYYFNKSNYTRLLWRFKEIQKEHLKRYKFKEPKFIRQDGIGTTLSTLYKLTYRMLKMNNVQFKMIEISVPNKLDDDFLIYYDQNKSTWISKIRTLYNLNGIYVPQCL